MWGQGGMGCMVEVGKGAMDGMRRLEYEGGASSVAPSKQVVPVKLRVAIAHAHIVCCSALHPARRALAWAFRVLGGALPSSTTVQL